MYRLYLNVHEALPFTSNHDFENIILPHLRRVKFLVFSKYFYTVFFLFKQIFDFLDPRLIHWTKADIDIICLTEHRSLKYNWIL